MSHCLLCNSSELENARKYRTQQTLLKIGLEYIPLPANIILGDCSIVGILTGCFEYNYYSIMGHSGISLVHCLTSS